MAGQTYLFIARIPVAGIDDYQQFIASVFPLIITYGGTLERRFASADSTVELFFVSFPTADQFEELQSSAHIDAAAPLLYRSGAHFEVIPVATDAAIQLS
jgi:hypothetical protein